MSLTWLSIVVNCITLALFGRFSTLRRYRTQGRGSAVNGRHLNMHAVFLHAFVDLASHLGVALAILIVDWKWVDLASPSMLCTSISFLLAGWDSNHAVVSHVCSAGFGPMSSWLLCPPRCVTLTDELCR